jgi:hypothetical protein
MTEELASIFRAVRQPTAANVATGFEPGKLQIRNELQRSVQQIQAPDAGPENSCLKSSSRTWQAGSGARWKPITVHASTGTNFSTWFPFGSIVHNQAVRKGGSRH